MARSADPLNLSNFFENFSKNQKYLLNFPKIFEKEWTLVRVERVVRGHQCGGRETAGK
jgi:hypothetical protein